MVHLKQSIATVANIPYTIQFWVAAPNAPGRARHGSYINVLWNGVEVAAEALQATAGYVLYSVVVMGTGTTSTLELDAHSHTAIALDDVSMHANVTAGVETTIGQITFTDSDPSDEHSATVTPTTGGDLGTLTAVVGLEPTGSNPGTVYWTYAVSDAAIAGLGQNTSLTQNYTITINDGHGGVVSKNVAITINGVNDAPVLSSADKVQLINEAATALRAAPTWSATAGLRRRAVGLRGR